MNIDVESSTRLVPPGKTSGTRPQRAASFCIGLLILQPVLFFWRVLINPRAHIPYDIEGFHLPLLSYIAQCVRRGIAPWWNPYPYCGVPIHADLQAQLFYPFTWIAILAGNHSQGRTLFYWVQFLVPLHMMLAGLFTLLLLRRLKLGWPAAFLGATIYQLGGFFASQAQHLGAVSTAPWLPLAILAAFELRERIRARWVAVMAIAIAMSILAGFAATALIAGGAVILIVAGLLIARQASWRIVPGVAAGFAAGAGIAAVELIPLWQLSRASMASLRANWFAGGGVPLEALVSLVFPDYYHIFEFPRLYKLPYNFTFLYVYCGLAAILLIPAALFVRKPHARLFLALTILSVFWMLGGSTPVYPAIVVRLPDILRGALYAAYASMAFCCFAALTAAIVFGRFERRAPQALLWGIALFTSYDLIHTGAGRPMNTSAGGYKTADSEYHPARAAAFAESIHKLVNRSVPPSRIDYTDGAFAAGIRGSEMLSLPTANGDNPFLLKRMLYLRRLFTAGQPWDRQLSISNLASPLLRMQNVEWIAGASPIPADQLERAGLEFVESVDGFQIYRNTRVLPRFFLVPRVRRSQDETQTFGMLAQDSFDPAAEAIVEGISGDVAGLANGDVRVALYSANRLRLKVSAGGPAFLATSEPMYEGWQATVNGRPQPILMTNGAFRGLMLAAGTSDIVMEYRPAHFTLAWMISALSLIGTAAMALRGLSLREAVAEAASARRALGAWAIAAGGSMRVVWIREVLPRRAAIGWAALLLLTTVLYYWKILLTREFSLLTESEGIRQAYTWLRFWTDSIRHGNLPIWDPYTLAGHSFAGEMQTAVFYPLHLLLALFPPNKEALFSPRLYHVWFAFTHFLGAVFMFALVREFKLSRFAAFIAGICFSLGGFVARMPWPHMLESSIWLPLLFLFFLRALRSAVLRATVLNAATAGLMLGLSILAGGMHIVIMQTLVVVSAGVYQACTANTDLKPFPGSRRHMWTRASVVAGIVLVTGLAAGAVQLLPSVEYSKHAIRFLGSHGALPASEPIPYDSLSEGMSPAGFISMLIPIAFNGVLGTGEVTNPYLGVFPLLLALLGLWWHWQNRWVRYLAGLAAAAFLYSWGAFSPLHGVLYAIVPRLWMAREASRIVYLADFSFAILAAFGIDALFSENFRANVPPALRRILGGVAILCAAVLAVPAIFGHPATSPWIQLSIVLILLSYGLFRHIASGNTGRMARVLIAGLILFDLNSFDWMARNTIQIARDGVNHLDRLISCRGAVRFLKSKLSESPHDPFRVEVATDPKPNIADAYAVQTTSGAGVTIPIDFTRIAGRADLLNVRYRLAPASTQEAGAIYADPQWKVYQNVNVYPRGWIVHESAIEPSAGAAIARLESPGFDPRRTAVLDQAARLQPRIENAPEEVRFTGMEPNRLEIDVRAGSGGLLVLSEMYYPGWSATVNGRSARVYRANGVFRGVEVPEGDSRVVLTYQPLSVYFGGLVTLIAFGGVLAAHRAERRIARLQAGTAGQGLGSKAP